MAMNQPINIEAATKVATNRINKRRDLLGNHLEQEFWHGIEVLRNPSGPSSLSPAPDDQEARCHRSLPPHGGQQQTVHRLRRSGRAWQGRTLY